MKQPPSLFLVIGFSRLRGLSDQTMIIILTAGYPTILIRNTDWPQMKIPSFQHPYCYFIEALRSPTITFDFRLLAINIYQRTQIVLSFFNEDVD